MQQKGNVNVNQGSILIFIKRDDQEYDHCVFFFVIASLIHSIFIFSKIVTQNIGRLLDIAGSGPIPFYKVWEMKCMDSFVMLS